jgi:putative oxidoreductase
MEDSKKHTDLGILILRIGIGLAFALVYGQPKMWGGPEFWTMLGGAMKNFGITFAPEFWGFVSSLTEFGGGILLVLGLFTRPAAAFMAINMIVAMTTHFKALDPWYKVITPIEMFTVFLALLFLGAGRCSLDYLIFGKRRNKAKPN